MKILAIASKGGHWVQLLRITTALKSTNISYVSTSPNLGETVKGKAFYTIPDGSRDSLLGLIRAFFKMIKIIRKSNPDVILTTGSAPALTGIIVGKLMGKKTIWIDSIANAACISTSGKIASYFASRAYTQWPQLSNSKFRYNGNILS